MKRKILYYFIVSFLVILLMAEVTSANSSMKAFASEDIEVNFTILHTNDEHSALIPLPLVDYHAETPNPSLGGIARLSHAVAEIRNQKEQEGEPVLLVSAGDYIGGSPFSWLVLEGMAPELSLMLEIGYDVITIGNHEYDYGTEALANYLKYAGYPEAADKTAIVATNTDFPHDYHLAGLGIEKTFLRELDNGLVLGFFGLIGKGAIDVTYDTGLVEFGDQHSVAREAVEELTSAGADVIIAVTHSGIDEDLELAREVEGIDLIIGGHSHTFLNEPIVENNTIVAQAGEKLQMLGFLELAYNTQNGALRVRNSDNLLPLDHTVNEDPIMVAKTDKYIKELNALVARMTDGWVEHIEEIIVSSNFELKNKPELTETAFGNFVADAFRFVGEEALSEKVDFAFQANGAIRGSLIPGTMSYSQGKVSFFDLTSLVGLGVGLDKEPGYPMVSAYFTGDEIRRILEITVLLSELLGDTYYLQLSGIRMEYDPNRAILMTVPFKNIPIPTSRAVLSVERYVGDGVQDDDNYIPLNWGDEELYHVVTDYYIASFLPFVGEMLPNLSLVMKDKDGNPVELDDRIIYRNGQELKVWQAVIEYAANQPEGSNDAPYISEHYSELSGRLVQTKTIPLLVWPALGFVIVVALVAYVIKRRKKATSSY